MLHSLTFQFFIFEELPVKLNFIHFSEVCISFSIIFSYLVNPEEPLFYFVMVQFLYTITVYLNTSFPFLFWVPVGNFASNFQLFCHEGMHFLGAFYCLKVKC